MGSTRATGASAWRRSCTVEGFETVSTLQPGQALVFATSAALGQEAESEAAAAAAVESAVPQSAARSATVDG